MKTALVVFVVAGLWFTASAQEPAASMPQDSDQYALAQQVFSAVSGYEGECYELDAVVKAEIVRRYKTYQMACGGHFSPVPPLQTVDDTLQNYEPVAAWEEVSGNGYSRSFLFGAGELQVNLLGLPDRALIFVVYQEPKSE